MQQENTQLIKYSYLYKKLKVQLVMSVTYIVTDLFVKRINICMGFGAPCRLNLLIFRDCQKKCFLVN